MGGDRRLGARNGGFVQFLVLGPLEVRDGERILPLGGAKQRAALAILLLNRNRVVSRDRLVDGVWGDVPPTTAAHTLETYISRLRKALHQDGQPERLMTRPPGYLLRAWRTASWICNGWKLAWNRGGKRSRPTIHEPHRQP